MIPYKPVCGTCEREPDVISNDEGGQQVVCRGCGQTDTLEEAKRIAGEHLLQELIPDAQKEAARIAKRELGIKMQPKRVPRRTFRWHGIAL